MTATSPSPGGPLTLTIKSLSPSPGAKTLIPALERCVDPNPDWTLEDLQKELEAVAGIYTVKGEPTAWLKAALAVAFFRIKVPVSLNSRSPPLNANGFSWRDLSVTSDFGRTSGTFRMRAFSVSDTDDSDEEEETVEPSTSGRGSNMPPKDGIRVATDPPRDLKQAAPAVRMERWGDHPLLARTQYVESALLDMERERHTRVQEEIRRRRLTLENALREEMQREVASLAQVEKDKEAKCELARRSDMQDLRQIAELRDMHLSALQRDHELRSQFEARQIRKEAAEEDARRQEIAVREGKERQMKARIEAEAKRKADSEKAKADVEAATRKAQADAAATAALQRAEEDRKRKEDLEQSATKKSVETKQPAARVPTGTKPRVAPTAAKLEEARKQTLGELQEAVAPLQATIANQKELKICERLIIKHLQQIAATQQQVQKKSMDLLQLLHDPRVPTQFLITTLGAKLLSQCESQVLKLPSFAFALAQVTVNVASQVPYVMDAVLAKLHEVCIFTVPKYYGYSKDQFESDAAYFKALGYREEEEELESTDDYVARMTAYMTFYGAIVQTDAAGGQNPHGLADGWAWCARLLNHIPANRSSASALEAVIKMAGFRLYQVYPKPFMKLMQTVVTEFIVNLKTAGDPDSRAVVSRLESYLHHQKYLIEPEGRRMPTTDISASLKA